MLRRKTTLPMSFVFLVVWTVLLGGQGARSLDAAAVDKDYALVQISPDNSAPLPMTCKDITVANSRVVITLAGGLRVLCDTDTDGGGWIVFQRRLSSDVDFHWANYKYGFGDMRGNFWLGNEKIHRLTFLRRYQLRVDFIFNGNSYFAEYSTFRVLGEAEKYRLQVGGYSGNAGDSFGYHNGFAFSTTDRDNDGFEGDCATKYHGAWWYGRCHQTNLNGQWGAKGYGVGLTWALTTDYYDSATSTEMKIRPLD